MSISEIMPIIEKLPTSDKLRIIQILAAGLLSKQPSETVGTLVATELWSPYDSHQAADTLMRFASDQKEPS